MKVVVGVSGPCSHDLGTLAAGVHVGEHDSTKRLPIVRGLVADGDLSVHWLVFLISQQVCGLVYCEVGRRGFPLYKHGDGEGGIYKYKLSSDEKQ